MHGERRGKRARVLAEQDHREVLGDDPDRDGGEQPGDGPRLEKRPHGDPLDDHAEQRERDERDRQRGPERPPEPDVQRVGDDRADHDRLPLREVHGLAGGVGDVVPERHERVHAPEREAGKGELRDHEETPTRPQLSEFTCTRRPDAEHDPVLELSAVTPGGRGSGGLAGAGLTRSPRRAARLVRSTDICQRRTAPQTVGARGPRTALRPPPALRGRHAYFDATGTILPAFHVTRM